MRYLPIWDNYLITLDGKFTAQELSEYYEESIPVTVCGRWQRARILHMASKMKPWRYQLANSTALFLVYYEQSPYREEPLELADISAQEEKTRWREMLENEKLKCPTWMDIIAYLLTDEYGCYRGNDRENKITLSLTSFPARIKTLDRVLLALLNQTMKPDRILLWLSPEDFPGKEKELPRTLLALKKHGLEIRWCENLLPHKKYFYSMQTYPNDIVITVDDDVVYSKYLVETLFDCYTRHPYAISAMRVHMMRFTVDGNLMPYSRWYYQCLNYVDMPMMSLFATGVGGVLYPPHLMHDELNNIEKLKEICLYADDIWLKVMQVMNNIPVVLATRYQKIVFVGNTQESSLYAQNVHNGRNDVVLANLLAQYDEWFGKDDTLITRIRRDERTPENLMRIKKKKKTSLKDIIKKFAPTPVKSFMREIGILKREHKQIRFILYGNHKEACDHDKSISEKLDAIERLLIDQREQIDDLKQKLLQKTN